MAISRGGHLEIQAVLSDRRFLMSPKHDLCALFSSLKKLTLSVNPNKHTSQSETNGIFPMSLE